MVCFANSALYCTRSQFAVAFSDMNKALTISYRSSDFLQTLRVWFQQFPSQAACDFLPLSLNSRCRDGRLCCRTFCPTLRDMTWRSIYVASEYESLADVRKRITDWLLENPGKLSIKFISENLKTSIQMVRDIPTNVSFLSPVWILYNFSFISFIS